MINVCKEFQICFSGSFGVAPLLLASSLGRRREYLTERICEDEEREKVQLGEKLLAHYAALDW